MEIEGDVNDLEDTLENSIELNEPETWAADAQQLEGDFQEIEGDMK